MKVTTNWLQNYTDLTGLDAETIARQLTMLGLEVDSVYPVHESLQNLKTGLVTSCRKHPDADKLSVCEVQIGEENHQIVCGAPNVREGLKVVVALPGTVLPGDFKIKKSKIRGVTSAGMICSERELGLGDDHDGIMELPDSVEHGKSFLDEMGMADTGIEIDLTPNRPDCTSVIGVAREIAAINSRNLKLPVNNRTIQGASENFSVIIEKPEFCSRYCGKLVSGVKVAPSPLWLRNRLLSVGLRPINNVVDITNYVMLEYGQPLHAFDFDTLDNKQVVVRTRRDHETEFTTLDGTNRTLEDDMLLICDGVKPVAIAGVMGGLDSEVTDRTTNVLLESACFNPVSIRRTARRLNLSTDASYRFERGVDPLGTINALDRAAELLAEIAGGTIVDQGVDNHPAPPAPVTIVLDVERTNRLLGLSLSSQEAATLLESIELRCTTTDQNTLEVVVPSFRVDIEREADLVEEVARLYGYDNIPTTLPTVSMSYPEQDTGRRKRLFIVDQLSSAGFTECINYSFTAGVSNSKLGLSESDHRYTALPLLNPLSEEQSVMRTCLLPGLLENVHRNINFQRPDLRLFELGKVFFPKGSDSQPEERFRLSGVLSGNRFLDSSPLHFHATHVDIFDAKGAAEFILERMGLRDTVSIIPADQKSTEVFCADGYGLLLQAENRVVGSIGKFSQAVLSRFSIKNDVYFFDIDFDFLCNLPEQEITFTPLPVYPAVKRDVALVVGQHVSAGELLETVRTHKDKLIEDVCIFDVFTSEKLGPGQKSVALSITYRSKTKTLTDKNVEKSHSKIVRLLTERFGGSLRNA